MPGSLSPSRPGMLLIEDLEIQSKAVKINIKNTLFSEVVIFPRLFLIVIIVSWVCVEVSKLTGKLNRVRLNQVSGVTY